MNTDCIHYENYMYDPRLAAVCLNCKHEECDGICREFRDAFRRVMGIPERKMRGGNIIGQNGQGIWKEIEYRGECHTLSEWADITGMSYTTLRRRIADCGWTIEQALSQKPRPQRLRTEVEVDGRSMTVTEWAAELGVGYSTVYKYIKKLGSKEAGIRHFMKEEDAK